MKKRATGNRHIIDVRIYTSDTTNRQWLLFFPASNYGIYEILGKHVTIIINLYKAARLFVIRSRRKINRLILPITLPITFANARATHVGEPETRKILSERSKEALKCYTARREQDLHI